MTPIKNPLPPDKLKALIVGRVKMHQQKALDLAQSCARITQEELKNREDFKLWRTIEKSGYSWHKINRKGQEAIWQAVRAQ